MDVSVGSTDERGEDWGEGIGVGCPGSGACVGGGDGNDSGWAGSSGKGPESWVKDGGEVILGWPTFSRAEFHSCTVKFPCLRSFAMSTMSCRSGDWVSRPAASPNSTRSYYKKHVNPQVE